MGAIRMKRWIRCGKGWNSGRNVEAGSIEPVSPNRQSGRPGGPARYYSALSRMPQVSRARGPSCGGRRYPILKVVFPSGEVGFNRTVRQIVYAVRRESQEHRCNE